MDQDYLTANMYLKLKENEPKSIQNYYFKLFFKHLSQNSYTDFDYCTRKDNLIVAHSKLNRVKNILNTVKYLY